MKQLLILNYIHYWQLSINWWSLNCKIIRNHCMMQLNMFPNQLFPKKLGFRGRINERYPINFILLKLNSSIRSLHNGMKHSSNFIVIIAYKQFLNLFILRNVLLTSNSISRCNKSRRWECSQLGHWKTFVLIHQSSSGHDSAFNLIKFLLVYSYLWGELKKNILRNT